MERSYKLNEDKALQLFSSESFLTLNKALLQSQGPEATVFISNLVDKYLYFKKEDKLKEDKWFFLLHSTQIKQTGMNEDKIRKYKKRFISMGILSTKMIGNPAKEWYKIDIFNLLSLIDSSPVIFQTSENREDKPCRDSEDCIIITNNNNNKEIHKTREESKAHQKNIIPPKLEWVKSYCKERKNNVDPEYFYDSYTSKGWKVGKDKMKDWQASVRTWERNNFYTNLKQTKTNFGTLKNSQKPTMKYKEYDELL